MECCDNDPVLAKRVRLILTAEEGSDKLNATIDKRISAIADSRAMVSWNRCRTYVRELDDLREVIFTNLGKAEAAERLWSFIALSVGVTRRLEDCHDEADDTFSYAVQNLGTICFEIENRDEVALAERVFGVFSRGASNVSYIIIQAMGKALGSNGREHLKNLLTQASASVKGDNHRISSALCDLADADNDIDA